MVSGFHTVGGLAGYNDYGTIGNSVSICSVNGTNYVGGLAGYNFSNGVITNSYNQSTVTGTGIYVGGLVSQNYGTITNSYSAGMVSGGGVPVGGLAGQNSGIIANSYWDTQISGQATSSGGIGLTTIQMKQKASYSGWDFTNIWKIDEAVSYPSLQVFLVFGLDIVAPWVSTTNPANNAVDVAVNTAITANFSEAMLSSSITSTSFTLTGPSGLVTGSIVANGQTATFTPSADLAYSTLYTAMVTTVAKDLSGNGLASSQSWSFTTQPVPDAAPPVTTALPGAGSYNKTQAVTLSCSDIGTGCKTISYCLGAIASNCDPSSLYTGGTITISSSSDLRFFSTDNAWNSEVISTATYTIGGMPPTLFVSTLANGASTNNATLNVSGTVWDADGLLSLTIKGTPLTVQADTSFSAPVTLSAGPNTIVTIATDLAGNSSSDTRTITLDTMLPGLIVTYPADNSVTNSITTTVTGTVDGAVQSALVSLGTSTFPATIVGNVFSSPSITLAPGMNTITIDATDLAGNATTVKRTITFDDVAPALYITDPVQDLATNLSSYPLQGTTDTNVTVSIDFDGSVFQPQVIEGTFTQALTFSAEKTYDITVTATDQLGNTSTATRNIIYDKTPATFTIDPFVTPTNKNSQTIGGTIESGATLLVTCPTATVGSVTYPTDTTWQAGLSDLTEGGNTISIIVTDIHGNIADPVSYTVLLDTVPATIAINSPAANSTVNHTTVGYTLSELIASSQIEFIRTGGASDSAAHVYPLLPADRIAGDHTVNTGLALVNSAVYKITFTNVKDVAGNAGVPATNSNVTFDTQSIGVTKVAPSLKSIITTATVGYTLSEDAASGTVTFTRTGGSEDSASHVYALQTSSLGKGPHTVDTGLPLVKDAFYKVTLQFTDKASNPPTTVSSAMIFFDSNYGKGPIGNVANEDGLNIVNDADVAKLNSVMGTRPGDPNWNPACDLDKNNKIDQKDLMLLQMHYGE
jgi:hypothetical protein